MGRKGKKFSPEFIDKMRELLAAKVPPMKVAEQLACSDTVVYGYLEDFRKDPVIGPTMPPPKWQRRGRPRRAITNVTPDDNPCPVDRTHKVCFMKNRGRMYCVACRKEYDCEKVPCLQPKVRTEEEQAIHHFTYNVKYVPDVE